jgi:hypothetical protein
MNLKLLSLSFVLALAAGAMAQHDHGSGGHSSGGSSHASSGGGMSHSSGGFSHSFGGSSHSFGGSQSHSFSGFGHSFGGSRSSGQSHSFGGSRSSGGSSGFGSRSFGGSRSSQGFGSHSFGSGGSRGFGGTSHSSSGFTPGRTFGGYGHSQGLGGTSRSSGGFGQRSSGLGSRATGSGLNGNRFGGVGSNHPAFGNSFNFTGHSGLQRQNFEHDRGFGSSRVRFGNGGRDRFGFFGRPGFRESNFFFGFYLFSPFVDDCVYSPWYTYSCLPPYIPYDRIVVEDAPDVDWSAGDAYSYNPNQDGDAYGNTDLNYSLDEINGMYTHNDEAAVDVLVPSGNQVAIWEDGKYMYSVNGSDFRQMYKDSIKGTETDSFTITSVHHDGDTATVQAKHVFTDPESGKHNTVYQEYRLRHEGDKFVVTDFSTSTNQSTFSRF